MTRSVTADHILFDECINAFRPDKQSPFGDEKGVSISYLLTSFNIPTSWHLPHCTIHPSISAHTYGAYSVFISKVDNPPWCRGYNAHLYGIALSAIVTFVTGRSCKSTRNSYYGETLTDSIIGEFSLVHPILTAGPGSTSTRVSATTLQRYQEEITNLVSKLHTVPYPTYIIAMQAIRLVHLSQVNKKDDFGLAYLLVISAIEAVAQKAFDKKKVAVKNPSEATWAALAKEGGEFGELYKAYTDARSKNNYLKERYIKFITTFAPASDWEKMVPHPRQDTFESLDNSDFNHLIQKSPFELYPEELNNDEILQLLSDSYKHRSCFVHRGEQPPHQNPQSYNRFFQEYREYDEGKISEGLLPNYELLVGIARHSILAWLATK